MVNDLRKILANIVRLIGEKYLLKELKRLIDSGKIEERHTAKIIDKVEFDLLSGIIENIYDKYHGKPTGTTGELIASQFNVVFELEDGLEVWNKRCIRPVIETVVEQDI